MWKTIVPVRTLRGTSELTNKYEKNLRADGIVVDFQPKTWEWENYVITKTGDESYQLHRRKHDGFEYIYTGASLGQASLTALRHKHD